MKIDKWDALLLLCLGIYSIILTLWIFVGEKSTTSLIVVFGPIVVFVSGSLYAVFKDGGKKNEIGEGGERHE